MITPKIANEVWDILCREAGASERERGSWLAYTVGRSDIPEYRFRGYLGLGGKVRLLDAHAEGRWYVYYYPEDRSDYRESVRLTTNLALRSIPTTEPPPATSGRE